MVYNYPQLKEAFSETATPFFEHMEELREGIRGTQVIVKVNSVVLRVP
jgi:hypothetical protein